MGWDQGQVGRENFKACIPDNYEIIMMEDISKFRSSLDMSRDKLHCTRIPVAIGYGHFWHLLPVLTWRSASITSSSSWDPRLAWEEAPSLKEGKAFNVTVLEDISSFRGTAFSFQDPGHFCLQLRQMPLLLATAGIMISSQFIDMSSILPHLNKFHFAALSGKQKHRPG